MFHLDVSTGASLIRAAGTEAKKEMECVLLESDRQNKQQNFGGKKSDTNIHLWPTTQNGTFPKSSWIRVTYPSCKEPTGNKTWTFKQIIVLCSTLMCSRHCLPLELVAPFWSSWFFTVVWNSRFSLLSHLNLNHLLPLYPYRKLTG